MGRVDGKVAFITGAARGQGRSHAVRLAEEGANIIAVDICDRVKANVAEPATWADLEETAAQVEAVGGKIAIAKADVRSYEQLSAAVQEGVQAFGRLDIVCANAGVWTYGKAHELEEWEWHEVVDVVLTGVWLTCKATVPKLIEQGTGGSVILTSSLAGLQGCVNLGHYAAAKHGVVGLMRTMANELAPHKIRVNCVNPGTVNTLLAHNAPTYRLFAPDVEQPGVEVIEERFGVLTALDVPWVEPIDISNMVLYLGSDEARYVTGTTMSVDAGSFNK
jgi:(+)-trans-carveol dehydrogenase